MTGDESVTVAERLQSLGERTLNPILVKEVRQSLRGRYFRVGFLLTLIVAALVSVILLIAFESSPSPEGEGPIFFMFMYGFLTVAVFCLVPFQAFQSMSSEWDENTYDLLVLSNLRPRHIVLGKTLSATVLSLLFFSAFGPFLVFAFLLRNVELVTVLVALGLVQVLSVALSVLAIGLASLTHVRFFRIFLMAMLGVGLVMGTTFFISYTAVVMFQPFFFADPGFFAGLGTFVAMAVAFCLFVGAVACTRLAHPEENRSTPLRVLTLVLTVVALAALVIVDEYLTDPDMYYGIALAMLFGLALPATLFVTEPERLGRRVGPRIPGRRLLAALEIPLLPGGGRGFLFFLLVSGLFVCGAMAIQLGSFTTSSRGAGALLVIWLYLAIYLGLPGAVFAPFSNSLRVRAGARLLVPILFLLGWLLPTLVGFFAGNASLREGRHPGNFIWVMDRVWGRNDPDLLGPLLVVLVAAGGVLLINVPRMVRGMNEVRRASARRRLSEHEGTADAPAGS